MPESSGRRDAVLFSAIIRAPVAPMHAEPRISSAMVSQQLAGHRVDALAEDDGGEWARVRGGDDYEGWIHAGFLAKEPATTARQSRRITRISLGCSTRTASGVSRVLPLRAFLAPDETLVSGEVIESTRRAARFPLEPSAIVASASAYFAGTSYLWGGVTPWGADCSGFVQTVFALHGKQLPRDASQQAQAGEDAGTDATALEAGDLLFFSDREDKRVTHVGLATGDKRMVHLGLGRGGYSIERLTDRKDAFVALMRKRFLFARRVV
jgi:gamma-D-glutamyl-L-lysine dipeptidyl-peptidase